VIHHVGYVVPDLPRAIEWWTRTLGAGPFVVLEHIPFDEVTYEGAPALYDHSSAFGSYGAILVELTVVHVASPGLNERLVGHGVGHVGMLSDDLDAYETDLPLFHTGRSGPVRAHWYDGRATLGHHVEVLQRCPEILGLYERVRALT
jgi:catechol 2,3-dioxygenase-like lactoylglutathione lyase family enzyme